MLDQVTTNDNAIAFEPLGMSRDVLRRSFAGPLTQNLAGPMGEVRPSDSGLELRRWNDPRAYQEQEASSIESLCLDVAQGTPLHQQLTSVVWLFGPERVQSPDDVLRGIKRLLTEDGLLIVATECPWRGKILAPDEYAEQTAEEAAASLVRAGFGSIERHVDGPFFRIWSARLVPGSAHDLLARAAASLEDRDYHDAERILAQLDEKLSEDGVREYGLLVAACHDMAGRQKQAVEALSQILEMDPGCSRALCGLGRLAGLAGNLEKAGELFDRALEKQPALVAALRGKSAVAEARGKVSEAYAAVLAASDLRPTDDNLLVEAVRLGRACGKFAETERFLRDVATRRPLSPMVCAVIGDGD